MAERIKKARIEKRLTQQGLSELCGWKYQARVSHYETGEREPRLDEIYKLAKALDVTPEWILFGIGEKEEQNKLKSNFSIVDEKTNWIPIISWVNAGSWCYMREITDIDELEYVPVPRKINKDSIALRIKGDSMTSPSPHLKSFPEGSIIVVEPTRHAEHNDYVIAMIPGANEATFKQYVVDAGIPYLKPLNPQYPTMPFPRDGSICGVIVANLNFYK